MNYSEIFTASGRLVWNRRALWLIGMLAAFFGQGGYGYSANYNQSLPTPAGSTPGIPPGFEQLIKTVQENVVPLIALTIGGSLIWALIALFVGQMAIGAIIGIAAQEETGWREAFRQSRSRLGSLVGIALLLALPLIVIFGIAVIVILATVLPIIGTLIGSIVDPSGMPNPEEIFPKIFGAMACAIPLILLGILISLFMQGIHIFASRACLIENLGVGASIRRGWAILKSNIGYTLLNGLILVAIGIAFGFIAAIPALGLLMLTGSRVLQGVWDMQATIGAVGLVLYSLVMNVGLAGILTSFAETTWTKLYQAFVGQEAAPAPVWSELHQA